MNRRTANERRDTPRVPVRVPMQVAGIDTEHLLVTESMSLSRSAVSCRTTEFIAPLSKVDLTLILPPFGALSKAARRMTAQGVVVRCDRVPEEERTGDESEFDVACCFTGMDGESQSLLEAYVAWKILRSTHAGEERAAAGHGRPGPAGPGGGHGAARSARPPRRHGGRGGPRRGSGPGGPGGPGGGRGGRGGGRRGGGSRRSS